MTLMSEAGWLFLLRWIHFLSGITWIGLLYYFNLVQTPFVAETQPAERGALVSKLVPRALWWFRWGAMITFLSGWIYLLHFWVGKVGLSTSGAWAILLGSLLGSIMWANVWFVIWPNQKIVIQNAVDTGAGKPADPAAAPAGARAGLASRTNVVFSIPMLFFMGAASHLPSLGMPRTGVTFWIVALIIMIAVEVNALMGKPGTATTKPLATVSETLWAGFILAAVFYVWFEIARFI